jgi:sugar lactone lactonase YvrE
VNRASEGTVTIHDPGTPSRRAVSGRDANRSHFMQQVISVAFGAANTFATCHEGTQRFMGPTLWSADAAIYAKRGLPGWGTLGSHLDMMHETPLCLGIAHERDNVFWVSDGTHGNVARYDFRRDHGPGHDDHADGTIRRFVDARVTRAPDVPGHVALDTAGGWLYYVDTGGRRVMRLQTRSGAPGATLRSQEAYAEYVEVRGATVETVVAAGLTAPAGLALHEGRLFVTDHATNEIVAFGTDGRELARVKTPARGIMGITVGPDRKLWYVDAAGNAVVRLDP